MRWTAALGVKWAHAVNVRLAFQASRATGTVLSISRSCWTVLLCSFIKAVTALYVWCFTVVLKSLLRKHVGSASEGTLLVVRLAAMWHS